MPKVAKVSTNPDGDKKKTRRHKRHGTGLPAVAIKKLVQDSQGRAAAVSSQTAFTIYTAAEALTKYVVDKALLAVDGTPAKTFGLKHAKLGIALGWKDVSHVDELIRAGNKVVGIYTTLYPGQSKATSKKQAEAAAPQEAPNSPLEEEQQQTQPEIQQVTEEGEDADVQVE